MRNRALAAVVVVALFVVGTATTASAARPTITTIGDVPTGTVSWAYWSPGTTVLSAPAMLDDGKITRIRFVDSTVNTAAGDAVVHVVVYHPDGGTWTRVFESRAITLTNSGDVITKHIHPDVQAGDLIGLHVESGDNVGLHYNTGASSDSFWFSTNCGDSCPASYWTELHNGLANLEATLRS